MFMALSIRSPLTRALVPGIYKLSLHINITVMAFLWTLVHGLSFLFDHYLNFSLGDVFVPFFADHGHVVSQAHLALGILAFWAMVILMVTGFLRQRLPYVVFRSLHFLNVFVFIAVFFHASVLGTDLRAYPWLMWTFIGMNGLLAVVWISALWAMLQTFRAQRLAKSRAAASPADTAPQA